MNRFSIYVLLGLVLLLSSCEAVFQTDLSTESDAETRLNIRLTDDPIDLEEVNIDLQLVKVKGENGFEEIDLETNAGIYNLLNFQNGLDTLIASADLSVGQIREVRLILGENNTVVSGGETFDLQIPSGSQSGLKIKTCLDLNQVADFDLLLDFDAAASIHCTGNGKFIMRPVIRVMSTAAQCMEEEEEEEEDDSLDNLPPEVVDSLISNYDGYDYDISTGFLCDSTEVYEIKATLEDTVAYLYFEIEGEFVQSGALVTDEDIPETIVSAINTDYTDYNIISGSVLEITRASGMIWYSIDLASEMDSIEVIYSPEGVFICEIGLSTHEEEENEEEDGEEEEGGDQDIELPAEVSELLQENYPGYDFTSQQQVNCNGNKYYMLAGQKGPVKIILYFDVDWILINTGLQIDENQLPNEVQQAIQTDYSNYRIMNNKAWELTDQDEILSYRVYLKQNNSSVKIYVIYAADGTFLCQEE
ncbi:MAG: DUF4382 domain-containing protein [Saprospiraceae bacterium]|nr:DUF4382 domain-containing protein [Saprospiraceae bacterium]